MTKEVAEQSSVAQGHKAEEVSSPPSQGVLRGALSSDEYERRFKARIVERLTGGWTPASAAEAAQAEWDSVSFEDHAVSFENDPEGAADEELSYWGDGA